MAAEISSSVNALTPASGDVGRLHSDCQTAADVHARTAIVRAFRDRVWPAQRPSPAPALPPVPPVPAVKPVAIVERMHAAPAPIERITVKSVLEATAAHFGMTAEDLRSSRRTQPLTRRRQVAMFVARKMTSRSLPFIARKVGRKDHTTVLHAVRTIQSRLDAGHDETVAAVNAIVEQLGGAHE